MSTTIKIHLKEVVQNSVTDYLLAKIEEGGNTLYDAGDTPTISVGSPQYDFEMEIWVKDSAGEETKRHTVIVSQAESDGTIKPAGELPEDQLITKSTPKTQSDPHTPAESGGKLKPGVDLPDDQAPV